MLCNPLDFHSLQSRLSRQAPVSFLNYSSKKPFPTSDKYSPPYISGLQEFCLHNSMPCDRHCVQIDHGRRGCHYPLVSLHIYHISSVPLLMSARASRFCIRRRISSVPITANSGRERRMLFSTAFFVFFTAATRTWIISSDLLLRLWCFLWYLFLLYSPI